MSSISKSDLTEYELKWLECDLEHPRKFVHPYHYLFHGAAGSGSLNLVRYSIQEGVDINSVHHGHTALFNAIYYGHADVAQWLLDNGGSWNYSNHNENIAHWAAVGGSVRIMEMLEKEGIKILTKRLLIVACEEGNVDLAKWLIEKKGPTLQKKLTQKEFNSLLLRAGGKARLFISHEKRQAIVELLVNTYGASLHAIGSLGENLFHKAVRRSFDLEFIKWLYNQGVAADKVTKIWRHCFTCSGKIQKY